MGYVTIPQPAVGHLEVCMELQGQELRTTVDLLKALVDKYAQQYGSNASNGPSVASTRSNGPSSSVQQHIPVPVSAPTPAPISQAPQQQALPPHLANGVHHQHHHQQQWQPQQQSQAQQQQWPHGVPQPPIPIPLLTPPVSQTAQPLRPQPLPPQPRQPPPQLQQHQHQAAQPFAPMRQQPTAISSPAWRCRWTSDAEDHGGNGVPALAYSPKFASLSSDFGDGHKGWRVSASRGVLNLWECAAGGQTGGQFSLMVLHSQAVDFLSTRLVVEHDLGVLFAVSVDINNGAECIGVHSLAADAFLAYKHRFAPPVAPGKRTGQSRMIQQVASLHSIGGALSGCCAASYGDRVVVFEVGQNVPAGSTVTSARLSWQAHPGASVTALHKSAFAPVLFSGAADGSVHMWGLREKPSAPTARYLGHSRNVTTIHAINDESIATCSIDSKVMLWDLRRPSQPVLTLDPDGSPVLRLAPSPASDCLAVATNRGLHCVDLVDGLGSVAPIAPGPLARPFLDLAWNSATDELYASAHDGTISVFVRKNAF